MNREEDGVEGGEAVRVSGVGGRLRRGPILAAGPGGRLRPVAALALLAALSACGGDESAAGGRGGGGAGERPAIPVEVFAAVTDTVTETVLATGAVEAIQFIEVRPELQGRLVEISAREGTEVRQGAPLFRIDDAELQALVAQLEAERDQAVQALERTRELLAMDASSQADLESAEATARSREAQLRLQRVRLDRTVIRAPFAGLVGERFVSVGDYVTPSSRLTTLQTVDPQRAAFRVPERYAERLEVGQRVRFTVAAVNRDFSGVVDFVDPVVQLPSRTILIKAQVPNPERVLMPGMFVEAELATEVRPGAVVVPEDAILPLGTETYVWVVQEGTVSRRAVALGVRTPGFVEIREGVAAGEEVVVGGLQRMSEGVTVTPTVVQRTPPGGRGAARGEPEGR
ncbi:MAG: efflux RND transporter periplasmic adaptor subunit [Gemmatimonadota bacterium]